MNIHKAIKKIVAVQVLLTVCLFLLQEDITVAKDSFIADYIQTIYDSKSGIASNEVNCLYQSSSGYIWVGTDGGLYRSNGYEFSSVNLWDMDRTDVYSVNCITQDTKGRVWVGTDNYGLFYIEHGETHHFQTEYYDGIKTIYRVCENEKGNLYVATSRGLYICVGTPDGAMSLFPVANESGSGKYKDMVTFGSEIWAINNDSIFVIDELGNRSAIDIGELSFDEFTCISVFGNYIYVGTSGSDILVFKSKSSFEVVSTAIDGINKIMQDSEERVWICADNGIGFFRANGQFYKINNCQIDNYLSDIIQDYEGNYWISSTRMGVLMLAKSKFSDYNIKSGMQESMTNCVYIHGGNKYIGTDDGLFIYNSDNEQETGTLTDMLQGVSISHIMRDSTGRIWISTHRKYGVVMVQSNNTISTLTRGAGLPSMAVNCTYELNDGRIAVATEEGVAIIDRDGKISDTYDTSVGMDANNVRCFYQDGGVLWCGTDGGGISCITLATGKIVNYNTEDGLNSNVVTAIKKGKEGIWIATDNGLCFYNESFRTVSNIDFSNSVYDLIVRGNAVWVIGSKGVLLTNEEELLGSQGIAGRPFDKSDGLTKDINTLCHSTIDANGILYICCNNGICTLATRETWYNNVAPKIRVTAIDVDGTRYEYDDLSDGLVVDSNTTRITVYFAVFSFTNRNNISVEYYLDGFDENPIVISGSNAMEAVYTNLDGGRYQFRIKAYNGDGKMCNEEVAFKIEKQKSFFEKSASRYFILITMLSGICLICYAVLRVRKILISNSEEIEKLSKEHEQAVKSSSIKNDYLANMSNEIKTPINVMMAKADELLQLHTEDDEYKKSILSIYETGGEILNKVDDIILLAKIEAGKVDVVNEKYSVTTMIYELSELVMQSIGEKTVKFFVEIGDILADNVVGDQEKIKNILKRILENSVKYTKDGSITLSVDCYEYTDKSNKNAVNFVFTVSDTGIGIQEERLETIFEVFQIVDNKKNNIHSGNGVGLAIAKGLADIMNADLEAESTYGAGAAFTLSVNQTVADNGMANSASKVEEMVSKEVAEKLWLPEVNVLLVEDDEVSRQVAQKVLGQFELRVDVATSGIGAIDMVLNNNYDVVFMDLTLPIMSGMDAMKEIRELDGKEYKILPIVSMDADAIGDNNDRLLEQGFTDTLVKPMDIRRVAAIFKDCLPESRLKEKTNDIAIYIHGSRYREGLEKLAAHIDVENAIERIGGSIDVFNRLVVAYYNQNESAPDDLSKKLEKDIRGFKTKIHTIKTTSTNIGALSIAKEASRLEAAINIGNKEYVRRNLRDFVKNLKNILQIIQEYLEFADTITGTTDEEYNQRLAENKSLDEADGSTGTTLNGEALESIKQYAVDNDFELLDATMEMISTMEFEGEDKDFLDALAEVVTARDSDAIVELVTTYVNLKL